MSKISLTPNASGTGTFTIASPNSNTNRTLTLPDADGEISLGGTPAGTLIYFAASTPPTGFLKANGAAVSRTTYADLFAVIGTTWGVGNGSTTFNLPDLRGEFVRGWDDARGVDSGRSFGSAQGDAIRNITGEAGYIRVKLNNTHYSSGAFTSALDVLSGDANNGSAYTARYTFNASNVVPTANENRPRNIAALACIKY